MNSLKKLAEFCGRHTTPPPPELLELERETHLKTLAPQMLCGRLQGQFLSLLSCLARPSAILEIGTFTGYSAICLARGLQEGGVLHTIESNPELAGISRKYFLKTGLQDKIQPHLGDARDIVPALNEAFDLVYLDGGKGDYALFYDLVFEKVKSGGVILADNVLWDGKLAAQAEDKDSRSIAAFLQKVQDDPRVENVVLHLRDGLLLARKK